MTDSPVTPADRRVPTTAMVLAAGLGTRLRPLTDVRAKPAIPVAGEPIIRRIVAWLARAGVTDVVVNLHHRPETIAAVLGEGGDLGVRVRYSWEQPVLLGSAGGPRLALPILGAETFILVNGDTLAEVNLAALAQRHRDTGARVTMAVAPNHDPMRYGGVRVNADGRAIGFTPRGVGAAGTRHFTGVQIVDARVFQPLASGRPAATIGGVYDALLADTPGAIATCDTGAAFHDIGTPLDYIATSRAFADNATARPAGDTTHVHPSATLRHTILWSDVRVGAGARLDGCIVTDGVIVPAGAEHHSAILMAGPHGDMRAVPLS